MGDILNKEFVVKVEIEVDDNQNKASAMLLM